MPPERLVFGWSVGSGPSAGGPQTLVTITFGDAGSFTEIELEHTGVTADQQRQMFAAGWTDCFAGLDRYYTSRCSISLPSILNQEGDMPTTRATDHPRPTTQMHGSG